MSLSRQLSVHLVPFVAAVAVVVGAVGCGGDDSDADRPQPTTTTVATTTTTASPEASDEQALRQLAEDWYAASKAAYVDDGYDLAAINEYLVDPYLNSFVQAVEDYRALDQSSQPGEASRQVIEDVELQDESGYVEECIVDGEVLLDADGSVANDDVVTLRVRTEAVLTDAGWRFSERTPLSDEERGDQCDE